MTGAPLESDANAVRAGAPDASASAAGWAASIHAAWDRARAAVIEIGDLLVAAKAALPHGAYTDMVRRDLPFDERMARKYAQIARHGTLHTLLENPAPGESNLCAAKGKGASGLPLAVDTLATLARLDDDALKAELDAGRIKPDMTNAQAQRLVRGVTARAKGVALADAAPVRGADGPLGRDIADDLAGLAALGLKFQTVAADCPWEFNARSELGDGKNPSRKYPTMSIEELCELPVAAVAAEDCALYFWRPDWDEEGSLKVLRAWGFRVSTMQVLDWQKVWPGGPKAGGNGYWTQSEGEIVTLGVRGNPARLETGVPRTVFAEKLDHSAKPDEIQDRIERLTAGPYLELFARRPRDGWLCIGNEVPSPVPAMLEKAGVAA